LARGMCLFIFKFFASEEKMKKLDENRFAGLQEVSLDEMRKIQMDLLCAIHEFCQKEKIDYSLAYGTLIGAVRHKGFIPWDDDVDIMMTRPNYEKFCAKFNAENSRYKILTCFNDKNYYWAIGRVIDTDTILPLDCARAKVDAGVFVDVFTVDGLPDDEKKRESYLKKISLMRFLGHCVNNYMASSSRKIFLAIPFFVAIYFLRIFSPNFCAKILTKMVSKYSVENSELSFASTCDKYGNKIFPSSAFAEYIELPFEGKNFKAIKGYDAFLTSIYGDYMTPPKRLEHNFDVYYRKK
jgi:lipopolysaccharide cholinephosphotransferase